MHTDFQVNHEELVSYVSKVLSIEDVPNKQQALFLLFSSGWAPKLVAGADARLCCAILPGGLELNKTSLAQFFSLTKLQKYPNWSMF